MARITLLVGGALVWILGTTASARTSEGEEAAGPRASRPEPSVVLERFLARPDEPHRRLRARRRMRAEGLGTRAFMDVHVALDPAHGFRYEVEAEGGSRLLRDVAFRGLLRQEQEAFTSGNVDGSALTAGNYEVTTDGCEAEGLVRLRAVPRRREAALIDGRFVVTSETADLVRVEGLLARAPSFWLTRVEVVRHDRRIQGHRVQVLLESVAHVRLLGEVRMVVNFDYEMVDGDDLVSPPAPPPEP